MKKSRDTEANNAKRWENLNEAMVHFRQYISEKPAKTSLSMVDLLHVSNFKGGNASITEPIRQFSGKIKLYECQLEKIEQAFGQRTIGSLNQGEVSQLIELCDGFLSLTKSRNSKIRGFGPSYTSALLASHFPNLIPILDRRILNGATIETKLDKAKQVKDIDQHFGELIRACWDTLKTQTGMTLRELDKLWFVKPISE
ncbi:MAG: hypothetical protein ABJA10_07870 [Aestuariivirga sp.]